MQCTSFRNKYYQGCIAGWLITSPSQPTKEKTQPFLAMQQAELEKGVKKELETEVFSWIKYFISLQDDYSKKQ